MISSVRWLPMVCLLACSGKGDTGEELGGGEGGEGGALEAPLDNGPGGSLVMSASCSPLDDSAWQLIVGLGSACDMTPSDSSVPFARISVYHADLFAEPVDNEVSWTNWEQGQGSFSPAGSAGPSGVAPDGSLYLSQWDGADSGAPPEGGTVAGWYTMTLEDGTEIGAAFDGVWCGGVGVDGV